MADELGEAWSGWLIARTRAQIERTMAAQRASSQGVMFEDYVARLQRDADQLKREATSAFPAEAWAELGVVRPPGPAARLWGRLAGVGSLPQPSFSLLDPSDVPRPSPSGRLVRLADDEFPEHYSDHRRGPHASEHGSSQTVS